MADEPLLTYLRDHLAGASAAVEMLEHLSDEVEDPAVRQLAESLVSEIEADRELLRGLAERLGGGDHPLKNAAAWLGEKLSRLKLRNVGEDNGNLALFEALEALGLGIQGKIALWRALSAAAEVDPRLDGEDYPSLLGRAQVQYDWVERYRIELARRVLPAQKTTSSAGQSTNQG